MGEYEEVVDGEWNNPTMRGHKLMCCDCSLVHTMDFKIVKTGRGQHVEYRVWRDNRATAAARRKSKKK